MKQDQVITIREDGSIAGLQRKDGFDLRQMGHARINRASEVLWSETKQKWFVTFNIGPHKELTKALWDEVQGIVSKDSKDTGLVYFDEYDVAVEAEIRTLDYLRLNSLIT